MTPTGEQNEFEAKIPGQSPEVRIVYYISATDKNNHVTLLPKYAPQNQFSFTILSTRGEASASILWTHVIFILGAVLFVIATG